MGGGGGGGTQVWGSDWILDAACPGGEVAEGCGLRAEGDGACSR